MRAMCFCWPTGLDNLTNDLPVRPAFVPFVDQGCTLSLAGSDNSGGSKRGGFVCFACAPRPPSGSWLGRSRNPQIRMVIVRLSLQGGRRGAVV